MTCPPCTHDCNEGRNCSAEKGNNMTQEALAQTQEPVAHWSDCSVHSEPAYPKGECDCGGIVAVADYTALSDKYVALSDKYVAMKAQRTEQEPYALESLMYSNDRIKVDPVTGNVSIGTPQRTWVGLTDEEIKPCWHEACQIDLELTSQLVVYFAKAIEAKLKQKNGYAEEKNNGV